MKRKCTCKNRGECGYCPSVAITSTSQGDIRATSGAGTGADNTAYARAARDAADRIARRH